MSGKLRKIVKYFTNILLCIVIIAIFFALYGLIQLSVLDKPYANYFGYTLFEIESGSMAPSVNVDDMILVKITKKVRKNDVITYKSDSSYITHRVVEVGENKIITKGDSNNSEDKIIARDDVLGKVIKVFPRFGVWKKIILSPKVIIIIFITLIIFSLCYSYTGKKTHEKAKKNSNLKNKNINKKMENDIDNNADVLVNNSTETKVMCSGNKLISPRKKNKDNYRIRESEFVIGNKANAIKRKGKNNLKEDAFIDDNVEILDDEEIL